MADGWDGEAVTIRWTSSTLLRKMLMASRWPTPERSDSEPEKQGLAGNRFTLLYSLGQNVAFRSAAASIDPLGHQHARHDRSGNAAQDERNAARRSGHHDHRLR
jgi:hypothetical protein